jgi:acyl-coenzyme A thioesterase PaaI-like protein
LRIFPGPIKSQSIVSAPWIPHSSLANGSNVVRPEFLWAALDCTGGFAVLPIPEGKAVVLGELCARIDGSITSSEQCVVIIGWPLHVDGRKRFAGSAVYSSSGRPVAVGRATWIEVPASEFGAQ